MNKIINGKQVELTRNEITETETRWADADKEHEANQYKMRRRMEYPSMEEQLDKIYHDGIDAWKVDIKAIKDKYPKPE